MRETENQRNQIVAKNCTRGSDKSGNSNLSGWKFVLSSW